MPPQDGTLAFQKSSHLWLCEARRLRIGPFFFVGSAPRNATFRFFLAG